MPSKWKIIRFILLTALITILAFAAGCSRQPEPLVVYAGKGLKHAVDEIKQGFEQQHGIPLAIIYAGSNTLLTTLQKTRKGDVFIPGSPIYLKEAGELVTSDQHVAHHIPAFAARSDGSRQLQGYGDLLTPGVRIAVGNKDMNAIGRIAEAILDASPAQDSFRPNIVITASTVNELLQLVAEGEVDAALVWQDMLQWESAKGLVQIDIPDAVNKPKGIRVGLLSTSLEPERARRFVDYVTTRGREIFKKHGFVKK